MIRVSFFNLQIQNYSKIEKIIKSNIYIYIYIYFNSTILPKKIFHFIYQNRNVVSKLLFDKLYPKNYFFIKVSSYENSLGVLNVFLFDKKSVFWSLKYVFYKLVMCNMLLLSMLLRFVKKINAFTRKAYYQNPFFFHPHLLFSPLSQMKTINYSPNQHTHTRENHYTF